MPKGLVLTTWRQRDFVTRSKIREYGNPYAQVYAGVIQGLENHGWEVKPVLDQSYVISSRDPTEIMDFIDSRIETARKLSPDLVMHDNYSCYHQLWYTGWDLNPFEEQQNLHARVSEMMGIIQESLFQNFKGSVESVRSTTYDSWNEEISLKHRLFEFAKDVGIPTPDTMIFSDDWSSLKYNQLAEWITGSPQGNLMVKLIYSSGGEGVYPVSSQEELAEFRQKAGAQKDFAVVQRKLELPSKWPYSIRVVAWGETVMGAKLIVNGNHAFCSNTYMGGISLDLALPGQEPRTDMSALSDLTEYEISIVRDTAEHCGIDLKNRILPLEMNYNSELVGLHDANFLLRGDDYMVDSDSATMLIESNTRPGPPGTGMFATMHGLKKRGARLDTKIAIQDILKAVLSSKNRVIC